MRKFNSSIVKAQSRPLITVSRFQPFPTRAALFPGDYVLALQFPFNKALIKLLKGILSVYREEAIDYSRLRKWPGGWLKRKQVWFIESVIWPQAKKLLITAGFRIREGK